MPNPSQFCMIAYACKAGRFLPTSFEFCFFKRIEMQVGVGRNLPTSSKLIWKAFGYRD
jgi:hypothetical protein